MAVVDARGHTRAVQLDFMQPLRPRRSGLDELAELGRDPTWNGDADGEPDLSAFEIEQLRLLHRPTLAHHWPNLLHPAEGNQRPARRSSGVFQRNLRIPAVH
jgi:hypothetical protein